MSRMTNEQLRQKWGDRYVSGKKPGTAVTSQNEAPTAPPPWPLSVRAIAAMKRDGDRGVGDTLARVFNLIPAYKGMGVGDAFKAFMRSVGRSCGCADRQARLNQYYPYT